MKFSGFVVSAAIAAASATAAPAQQTTAEGISAGLSAATVPVDIDNYVRAETAGQFDRILKMAGGLNKLASFREPTPLDKQSVIRMNRDTLYSFAVVDIGEGAVLVMPENGGRYNSAMIVNEDEYINKVIYEPGRYDLTMAEFDTRYVLVAIRTLVNASDPADIKAANELQDRIAVEATSARPYAHPDYDPKSYNKIRDLLLDLTKYMPDSRGAFGPKDKTQAVRHMLGAAFGWGGLPDADAFYLNVEPKLPVGRYRIEVPKDVPVKAFWSVSVYNKDGFYEKNDIGVYNINSASGKANADGSMSVNLGGCEDAARVNCIPLTEGWNYIVRLYRPEPSVLDGSWTFPAVTAEN